MRVLVYGTLRQGQRWHPLLVGSRFVGLGSVMRGFRMLDAGSFPVVMYDPESVVPILGEVYEIDEDTQRRLDRLERYPIMYDRQVVPVAVQGPDDLHDCWMYVGHPDYWDHAKLQDVPPQAKGYDWKGYKNV